MKQQIENIIKKNLPEERNEYDFGIQDPAYAEQEGFNQALSQINTSLIADEVLKVVVEKIESIKRFKCGACDGAKCSHCQSCEMREEIIKELSNLSPNKENKNNENNTKTQ